MICYELREFSWYSENNHPSEASSIQAPKHLVYSSEILLYIHLKKKGRNKTDIHSAKPHFSKMEDEHEIKNGAFNYRNKQTNINDII